MYEFTSSYQQFLCFVMHRRCEVCNSMLGTIKHVINPCIVVGFYAAECYCQNEINCDGTRFETKNPRRCKAQRSAQAPGNAVVGFSNVFFNENQNFTS